MKEILKEIFEKYPKINKKMQKNSKKIENFDIFCNFLLEKNKLINLTAITDKKEIAIKHILDSIFPEEYFSQNSKVLDVGSGAGFPAIPLKILRDDLNITMLDTLNKRVNFLNEAINLLELKNIDAIHGRAEDFAHKQEFREHFDVVVARAVANLKVLAEYCLPFVKVGGEFIAYKSANIDEEILEAKDIIKILGGEIKLVEKYDIFGNSRSIVIIKKISNTPQKYPRKPNQIK
ncbi:MAG: 16S rRNA (guanine(527)-N(7))-methyltransferase RsmG [Clostridia bacterium]|nr:16S rRNA (guanine(527)-N(7))-methyltransferase RsmG [Clostridia bacterium]